MSWYGELGWESARWEAVSPDYGSPGLLLGILLVEGEHRVARHGAQASPPVIW